ncbi:MAG: carboxypeptidase-like regulatory domain-containing protein, partial [Acidobacteria bacterium]|nr:carboxypeptidase-like regulatory domain-containing protein [Acidobacteriota bacterium]
MEFQLEAGRYQITISAHGYRGSSTSLSVSPSSPSQMDFYLDPLVPPAEMAAARLRSLHRADATLIAGFVSDEESSQPLAGVRVRASGTALSAVTNARGCF